MLFELEDNKLIIDDVALLEDMKANVKLSDKTARAKLTYIKDGMNIPIDIAINAGSPKLSISSISISVYGRELTRNIDFNLNLSTNLSFTSVSVRGIIGDNSINESINNISEILDLIAQAC